GVATHRASWGLGGLFGDAGAAPAHACALRRRGVPALFPAAMSRKRVAAQRPGIRWSIGEEDFRDLMRPDPWAGNARMARWSRRRGEGSAIAQAVERARGIEKRDDVVVVGDEAAPGATGRRPGNTFVNQPKP